MAEEVATVSRGRGSRATKGTAALCCGHAGGHCRGGKLAAVEGVSAVQERFGCGGGNGVGRGGRSGGRVASHGIGRVRRPFSRAAGMVAVVAAELPAVSLHQGGNAGRGRAAAGQQRRALRWLCRRVCQRRPW